MEAIEQALVELRDATAEKNPSLIHARIELLDHATKAWAGRRMDRAIARAIAGQRVDAIEERVAEARGVDAHLADHARGRTS